jgi:iron-sulfur cluster assembly accessory protein
MIQLSENALRAVQKFKQEQNKPEALLRVGVRGGGCSGMSYDVQFVDAFDEKLDRVFKQGPVRVVVDVKSLLYLSGMTLDYTQEMLGGGFKFINPNAAGTCGCGTSFTV